MTSPCPLCPFSAAPEAFSVLALAAHVLTHDHAAEDDVLTDADLSARILSQGPLSCSTCSAPLRSPSAARNHACPSGATFACAAPRCLATFPRRASLRAHGEAKHRARPRKFRCEVCGEKFTSRYDLGRHDVRVHSGVRKKFMCEWCGAGFSQKSQMTMHKQRVHAGGVLLGVGMKGRGGSEDGVGSHCTTPRSPPEEVPDSDERGGD